MTTKHKAAHGVEMTLAMIKPDAVRAGSAEEIMYLIEQSGLTITDKSYCQLSKERAGVFYGEHKGKPFYPALMDFMTSGPIWALALTGVDAIAKWRKLMGPTDSDEARMADPGCIRAKFGTNKTFNACHGSDSPASASREIRFYFPETITEPLPSAGEVAAYVRKYLAPSLLPALTKLCKEKPSTDANECITWLGQYLLETSDNRGRVITEAELEAMGVIEQDIDLSDPVDGEEEEEAAAEGEGEGEGAADGAAAPDAAAEADVVSVGVESMAAADAISKLEKAEGDMGSQLDDMELQLAATRVQSSFRGYRARKEVTKMKEEQREMNEAATKLQATYRGHMTRKSMRKPAAEAAGEEPAEAEEPAPAPEEAPAEAEAEAGAEEPAAGAEETPAAEEPAAPEEAAAE